MLLSKSKIRALACTVSLFAMPVSAQAAQFISFDGQSGTYGYQTVVGSPFMHSFTFSTLAAGTLSATISSIGRGSTNIDFTSVKLNGVNYDIVSTGFSEIRQILLQPVSAGLQTITVSGVAGKSASYDGVLAFESAVPEPATWALMIFGFGMAGSAMRRRPAPNLLRTGLI